MVFLKIPHIPKKIINERVKMNSVSKGFSYSVKLSTIYMHQEQPKYYTIFFKDISIPPFVITFYIINKNTWKKN